LADVPKLQLGQEEVSECLIAGLCICGDDESSQAIRGMIANLRRILVSGDAALLQPKAAGRVLYDEAQAVLRVFRAGKAPGPNDHWWHLAYGNLATHVFTMTPLVYEAALNEDEAAQATLANLQWRAGEGEPLNQWQAVRSLGRAHKWDLEFWRLCQSSEGVLSFCPGESIRAIRVAPLLCGKLWRPSPAPPSRTSLPVRGIPVGARAPAAFPAAPGDVVAAPPARDIPLHPSTGDNVEDEGGPLAAAIQALEQASDFGDDEWEPPDSDDDVGGDG